ncbi:MAG TPA: cytochrome c [Thermoanaerobaculia bacterium]|nr:cytochrome c [Thermoanaerobaculia bacterium]
MKNFLAGALCAIALVAIVLAAYLGLGFMEVAADAKPSACEAALMTPSVHAAVRRQAPAMQNPLPDADATRIAGGKLYMDDCVGCHGGPGQPPSAFGLSFYPPAPQFAHAGSQYTEAQLFWVARHGIRMSGMFPQPHYSDSDLWSLVSFISHIRNLPPAVVKAVQASN